jgi:hypothetical protein
LCIAFSAATSPGVAGITVRPKRTTGPEGTRAATFFRAPFFTAARLGTAFFGADFFVVVRFGAAFFAVAGFAAARLVRAFFGVAVSVAACGPARLVAVLLVRRFFIAMRSAFRWGENMRHRVGVYLFVFWLESIK